MNNIRQFRQDGGFAKWIDDETARRHLATEAAEQMFDYRFSPPRFLGIQMRDMHQPRLGSSPTAITARMSRANVGMWDGTYDQNGEVPKAARGAMASARAVIQMYPFEGDTKATRVSCLAHA